MPKQMSPREFVDKWSAVNLSERSKAQTHFNDLCALLAQPTPIEADPDGTWYSFEYGLKQTNGKQGWADVWYRHKFAWEYKKSYANLDKAFEQLDRYRKALENPPLMVVSDSRVIKVQTNFTNTKPKTIEFTLDDLLDPQKRDLLGNIFTNSDAFKDIETREEVTQKAAQDFAELANVLRKRNEASESVISHFLIRILFCLFAEDTHLLPDKLFTKLVDSTLHSPKGFVLKVQALFRAMANEGGFYGSDDIKWFNGGLFTDDTALDLGLEGMKVLARVAHQDWSRIEPAILGTLFERSLDPRTRAPLGAHYTSKDDILLITEPVLMAPLRRQWIEVQNHAQAIVEKRDMAKGTQRTLLDKDLTSLLAGFADRIAQVRVLDPACGSGNFLYVALKQLLDLQNEVIEFTANVGLPRLFLTVSPQQLYGIEKNEYAHNLAQTTVWIGYIQWRREKAYSYDDSPILKSLNNIEYKDAILAYDEHGKPVEPDWPEADVIIGNPPFKGDKKMRSELGDDYVNDLRKLYEGYVPGGADFVTYWFERSREALAQGRAKRVGLLATQAIRNGANRKVLERIKETGDIFMAWSNRPWILEGAAVRLSIIGFDVRVEKSRLLNGQLVNEINADLSGAVDVTKAFVLNENRNICFLGMMKAGPFDLDAETTQKMLKAPINVNGKSNSDVVKRRLGGQDVVKRARDTWIIDFGVDMTEAEAAEYELPYKHVLSYVKPLRDSNRRDSMRLKWWIHGEPRRGLRTAIMHLRRCIVTPEVSKHRIFAWMDTSIVPDHKLHVFARDDDYFFGILHSKVHEVWSLAQCSWLGVGNDPSYSSSRTFDTFPFPWPPGTEPKDDPCVQAIAAAARDLVHKRDNWLNPPGATEAQVKTRTLTNLYNERPAWLDMAHRKLDSSVLDAYSWPHDLSDEQILEQLLALNLERTTLQEVAISPSNEKGA